MADKPLELVPVRQVSEADKRMEVIRRVDRKLRRDATRIVSFIADAARLDDSGLPVDGTPVDQETGRPEGWTGVRTQVARDARKPLKTRPGYLSDMVRVKESYDKQDAARQAPPELGADIRVYVQNNHYNYPTRDVTPVTETESKPRKR